MSEELVPYNEDILEQIEKLSGINYSPEKIALYLGVDKALFVKQWFDRESDVRHVYDRGQLEAEANVIIKQKELAESGNITATQIFLKEKENRDIENIRNHILFGK